MSCGMGTVYPNRKQYVVMPSASELLVEQAKEAERLRLLLLANECESIEEFRQRLNDLLKLDK